MTRPFIAVAVTVLLATRGFGRSEYYYPSDGTDEERRGDYRMPGRELYDSFGSFLAEEGLFRKSRTYTDCYWSEGGSPGIEWVVFATTNLAWQQSGVFGFQTYWFGTNGWNRASESVQTALGFVPANFEAKKNQLLRVQLRSGLTAVTLRLGSETDPFWELHLTDEQKSALGSNPSGLSWMEVLDRCAAVGIDPPAFRSLPQRCPWKPGNGGGDCKTFAPTHVWRYLSDVQRESNEKRIAERLAALPPPVPDPSLTPIHWLDDENEPFDERWRILVDFDFDGHEDMLLSEGMREFGNGGGGFDVYRWMDGLYLRIGDVCLHPACLQFEDVRGRYVDEDVDGVRVWSYWHLSACEGSVDGHRIGRFGVSGHESFMSYGCDGESTPGSAALSAILGAKDRIVSFRVQRSETSPDGVVTWKDWTRP